MTMVLKNGYKVIVNKYDEVGKMISCYFPDGNLFEIVIALEKDVEGYIKCFEALSVLQG